MTPVRPKRFLREVRMAQKIDHPNVCRVLALSEHEGERFCVMEMLEGDTLAERLQQRGRMSAEEALRVVAAVCDGLAAAHAAGVIHRDLKPGNILLAAGRAVIIDFGLAAGLAHDRSLTADGEVIGTLAYMAPEQLEEGMSSPASDVYALGVVMYEMLTGQKPHGARSPFRLAAQKARESHRTPKLAAVGVPRVWHEVIDRCLRADPKDRFQSAQQVKQALERGRPSAGFVLSQRRVFIPAMAAIAAVAGLLGWKLLQRDHVPSPDARALHEQAQAALAEAAPLRAARLLEQAVARDPSFIAARALLAAAYADLDQPERAREVVLEAAAAADQRWTLGSAERVALRAARAAVIRDHKQAAEQYRRLSQVTTGASRTFALVASARSMEQGGDRDGALRTLEAAVRGDPANPAAHVRLGLMLTRIRQHDRAIAEFRAAETTYQSNGNLEGLSDLLLARSGARLGDPESDQRDLARVLELSEKTRNRYHSLTAKFRSAVMAETKRDYDGAVRIAREAADQARREGMPIVAAQALGELGYAFVYLKRPEQAEPILQEAVDLAERAKATGVLAQNRMRLGEVLYTLRRPDEAMAVMEPAVAWLRQSGSQETFPLMLIKWGTCLSGTRRVEDAEAVFREALERAKRTGNGLYEAMALQRLGGLNADRDLVKSAEYFEQAAVLGRKANLQGVLFQAAHARAGLGHLDRAEQWIAEGEVAKRSYPPGVDRDNFEGHVLLGRAFIASRRGQCEQAEALARQAAQVTPSREPDRHILRACSTDAAKLRESLAYLRARRAKASASDHWGKAQTGAAVATLELATGDWGSAKASAIRVYEESQEILARTFTLQSALVLRASERKLGNAAESAKWTAHSLDLARKLGFDPPEQFGGRQDLLRLWNLGRP
ncbi:MAG: serine/threonine-protein kinase [Bryobacteraceae bacterium]